MLEKEVLDNIVNEITDNYHSEELFYLKSGHCMPNRDTITHIIMGLRQLMFPGYFDNENLNKTVPEFFVGHNITKIYNDLYCQIKAAFLQQAKDNADEAEIEKHTTEICSNFFASFSHIQNLLLKDVNAAIGRATNVTLKTEDPIEGIDPNQRDLRVAEVKFLRALYLFEIVKNWGQAPLVLEEAQSTATTSKLNSGAEFYTQILKDLQDVLSSSLPEKQGASDFGRASKAAARHLRALVYLTRGYQDYADVNDFKNAYDDAMYVIEKTGHSLLEDYAMVHRQSNEANDEVIFAVNYNNSTNNNNNQQSTYYLFSYREGWEGLAKSNFYANDYGDVMPSKYLYTSFDWKKDRRAEVTFMSPLNGDPATSVDGRTYGRNAFMNTTQLGSSSTGVADTVIHFPVPTEEGFRVYSKAEQDAANAASPMKFIYNYPSGSYKDCSEDDYFITGLQGNSSTTRAWLPVYKFKDAGTLYGESGGSQYGSRDIVLFRLAETYLIAAEAAVMKKDNVNALLCINAVRERAMHNAKEQGLAKYEGTVTIDDVLDERALELFGEAPRWNDLTRTGKLAERVLEYNWDVTHITGGLIQTQLSAATNAKYSLRPIPVNWLNTLSNGQELGNNPGWE